jgi:hypothetical protein
MLSMTLEALPVNSDSDIIGHDADGHRPAFDFGARPDAWSEAFYLGFTLGLEGEDPAIPAGLPPYEARAFQAGLVAGTRKADREYDRYIDRLHAERMEAAFGDPSDRIHDAERCGVC